MLDRTKEPQSHSLEIQHVPEVSSVRRETGIDIHYFAVFDQEVIKLDFLWDVTLLPEFLPSIPNFTGNLLREGTNGRNSFQFHQLMERYGAFFEVKGNLEQFRVTAYIQKRQFQNVLPLIIEMITEPAFPSEELEKLKAQDLNNLRINLKKTSFVANREFNKTYFKQEHPFGRLVTEEEIVNAELPSIWQYFDRFVKGKRFDIMVSGWVGDEELNYLNTSFGNLETQNIGPLRENRTEFSSSLIDLNWEDAVQTSIKLGFPFPDRHHKDTHKLAVANEILGGFFGSRLMKKIREEKGYTYGIYSRVYHLKESSYFAISADIMKSHRAEAIEDIMSEIKNLQKNPVTDDELSLVKNHMTGVFYNGLNSPFAVMDIFKVLHKHQLDYQYFYDRLNTIRSISSEELLEIYNTYFNTDNILKVMVG